jgi:alpha/beta superfamily hydrolase
MNEVQVTFSPAGDPGITLEGRLTPPLAGSGRAAGVVLCHPHPLYGGTMDNNVVASLVVSLAGAGFAVLRFNFRGVGRSSGSHAQGVGEVADAVAALDLLAAQPGVDDGRLGLAGYSFGAGVSLAVAGSDPRVRAVALVALPTQRLEGRHELDACGTPKFFVSGDRDHVSDLAALRAYAARVPPPSAVEIVAGADHFWSGHEAPMATAVTGFMGTAVGNPQ